MSFFDSPREREGKQQYGQLLRDVDSLGSSFGDVNTAGDVRKKFGVSGFDLNAYKSGVKNTFDAKRKSLATNKASALNRATRASSRSATPGMSFSNILSSFASGDANLQGQEAEQELLGLDKQRSAELDVAKLLESSLRSKDDMAVQKLGLRGNALKGYLDSLSSSSGFDDLLSGGALAAKIGFAPWSVATDASGVSKTSSIFSKLFGD